MANSADPDQLPTDLNLPCLQRQGISGVSRTRVNFTSLITELNKDYNSYSSGACCHILVRGCHINFNKVLSILG